MRRNQAAHRRQEETYVWDLILYPGAHTYEAELALTPECVPLCRWERFLLELYGKTECIYCHRVSALGRPGRPK